MVPQIPETGREPEFLTPGLRPTLLSACRGSCCLAAAVACPRMAIASPSSPQTPPQGGCAPKEPSPLIQRQGQVSLASAHEGLEVGISCVRKWGGEIVVPVLRSRDKATRSPFSPGPEFSFDLLPEARTIQVTVPPGPEVSVRLCHQWALECEELSPPFDAQVWSAVCL